MAAWISSDVPAAALLLTTTISSTTSVDAKSMIAARIESRSLYVGKTTEMRLPRQDTSMSLPAEDPRDALVRDEAMLDSPAEGSSVRWWVAKASAVVLVLGLRNLLASIV